MAKGLDLQALIAALSDEKLHIAIGKVTFVSTNEDRSMVYAKVEIFPEVREIVTTVTWESAGPDAGIFQLPQKDDLVLVGMADGDEEQAFLIRRITSTVDTVPQQALSGDTVVRSLSGQKAHLLSDAEILLGRGGSDPTEQLVLGNVFKAAYKAHLQAVRDHTHIGNLGWTTSKPLNEPAFQAIIDSPVDDDAMLSDISKTEK